MAETKILDLSNRVFILAVVLIFAIAISYVVGLIPTFWTLPQYAPREMTVSGEGKIYAVPDIATVGFGVTSEGYDVPTTVNANTVTMNKIISGIKGLGVKPEDIQTTQYSLSPRYEYNEKTGERTYKGYTLSQQILVKIRDFAKIGDILNAGTQNGATLTGDLSFTIDDPQKVQQQARDKAIAAARTKAEDIAKNSGLEIVKVLNVQEGYTPVYNYGAGVMMDKAVSPSAAPIPTIEPGQNEITVDVNVTFRIK